MRIRRRLPPALAGLVLVTLVGACSDDGGPGTPAASEPADVTSSSTTTTEALTPEEEVEAAYLRSWEVLAEALRELDATVLSEAFAGPALDVFTEEVERLKQDNTPVRLEVEHGELAIEIRGDIAQVIETYTNHSVLLDPTTSEPLEPDPSERVEEMQTLQEIEGRWLVVEARELS